MGTPYKVCPNCGSHLDPGERCECQDTRPAEAGREAAPEEAQPKRENPDGPALSIPGA